MTISSCPACHEPVMVPHGAPGAARVRCPLCSDEFVLSVVLEKLPPALVLLDAPASSAGDSGIALGSERQAGSSPIPQFGERPAVAPAFEFDASPGAGERKTVSPSARPKRKEKSIVLEMVKVVGGGVVGLGLAMLILWWGFHKDPFELGPKVAKYAKWMVPKVLRGESDDIGGAASSNNSSDKNGGLGKGVAKNSFDKKPVVNQKGVEGEVVKPAEPTDLTPGDPFSTPAVKKLDDDIPEIVLNAGGAKPKETKPQDPPVEPAKPNPPAPVKNLREVTVSDLSRAVTEAGEASADIDAAYSPAGADLSNEKKREFMQRFYSTHARLGELLLAADSTDPEVQSERAKLAPLLADLAAKPNKQKVLAVVSEQPDNTKRTSGGVCVIGLVKRIRPSGALREIDVELSSTKKSVVTVFSTYNSESTFKVGARVLLLGVIVPDPKDNLTGYDGESAEARFVHFQFPLPEEAPPPESTETPAPPADPVKPEKKPADAPEPEEKTPTKPAGTEAK